MFDGNGHLPRVTSLASLGSHPGLGLLRPFRALCSKPTKIYGYYLVVLLAMYIPNNMQAAPARKYVVIFSPSTHEAKIMVVMGLK